MTVTQGFKANPGLELANAFGVISIVFALPIALVATDLPRRYIDLHWRYVDGLGVI